MRRQIVAAMAVLLLVVGNAWGVTLNFDFDSGPGPNFSIVNSGGLWTVGTVGPDVQIAKPLDDRTFLPYGWISGGVVSNFKVEGDFSVTVDFSLRSFPTPTSDSALNEALLSAMTDSGEGFKVLRYAHGTGGNWIEAYTDKPLGNQLNSLADGRYRIERHGSERTGLFAPAGSESFTTIASVSSFSDPVYFELFAIQGVDVIGDLRCNTALDVSYDNLTIVADGVTGVVPEPSTIALLGVGALGLLSWTWQRRRRAGVALGTLLCAVAVSGNATVAATLVDDFDGGVSAALWDMGHFDAAGAPWTMEVPDADGALRITKPSDVDVNNLNVYAIIDSKFTLDGNLSVSVDFNLVDFPLSSGGWNEAVIQLVGMNSGNSFSCLRFTDAGANYAEGFSSLSPGVIGQVTDATSDGRLIVTRDGQEMSALIDRGAGPVLLGSLDSPELLGPMKVQILAAQGSYLGIRPTTALDVRFDNFTATAEAIVPEPSTLALLGVGAIGLLAYTWRRRRTR